MIFMTRETIVGAPAKGAFATFFGFSALTVFFGAGAGAAATTGAVVFGVALGVAAGSALGAAGAGTPAFFTGGTIMLRARRGMFWNLRPFTTPMISSPST